jgi:hypothetical protein
MRRATVLILLSASLLSAPSSSFGHIWSLLASLWTAPTVLTAPAVLTAPDTAGSVQPAPTTDEGCGLDPDGRPRCTPGS